MIASAAVAPGELRVSLRRVRLASREVLHDIHTTIAPGTLVGLLGPNGAGKTTLLRAIMGIVPADGTVQLGDHAGAHTGTALRRRCGYVPQKQEVAWDFPISIAACVATGTAGRGAWLRPPRATERAAATEAIARVGLTELARRPIGELSGGQRQRVLVARALVRRPALLLLDEPFTGVDAPTADSLLELFRSLADHGTTIVISSHNLSETIATADRILLLNRTLIGGDQRTAQPWQDTFGVSESSALVRHVLPAARAARATHATTTAKEPADA